MSKKRGLSHDEKRDAIQALFLEDKTVFNLKELEKIAPKRKGVISQSVKDVVQSLVDDNLVSTDKIGIGVFFWLFASAAYAQREDRLTQLREKLAAAETQCAADEATLVEAEGDREETEERTALLARLNELEGLAQQQTVQLTDVAELDPALYQSMVHDTRIAKDAANRWLDAIGEAKSFVVNKAGKDPAQLDKHYGIPDDMDYL